MLVGKLRLHYVAGKDPRIHFEKVTGESHMTVGECLTYWKEQ